MWCGSGDPTAWRIQQPWHLPNVSAYVLTHNFLHEFNAGLQYGLKKCVAWGAVIKQLLINTVSALIFIHTQYICTCKETSGVRGMKWGQRRAERRSSFRTTYYLCGSPPNSHRTTGKHLPKESGNERLFILSVHTKADGALHTQTGAHSSTRLRTKKGQFGGVFSFWVSGSLVRWLSGYLNKRVKGANTVTPVRHMKPL